MSLPDLSPVPVVQISFTPAGNVVVVMASTEQVYENDSPRSKTGSPYFSLRYPFTCSEVRLHSDAYGSVTVISVRESVPVLLTVIVKVAVPPVATCCVSSLLSASSLSMIIRGVEGEPHPPPPPPPLELLIVSVQTARAVVCPST